MGAAITSTLTYVTRRDGALSGTLYAPPDKGGPFPAVVAVHGGGWRRASTSYEHLGPWLAARGYVVFAPTYRLAAPGRPSYPMALHDVRAAIRFVRAQAGELDVDPNRIALLGDSAGAHLASLAALTATGGTPPDPEETSFGDVACQVKLVASVYGIYDLAQQWRSELLSRPHENIVELFLGKSLVEDRRIYFEASPMSHVTRSANGTDFLLAWGTEDDIVDPRTQSLPFLEALKQAGFYVRTVIAPGAPHYWMAEPLDEPGSSSAHLAARLMRFLQARL